MTKISAKPSSQDVDKYWVVFPGGELEGKRPRALCRACREKLLVQSPIDARRAPALCFQCYRTGLERDRALLAAGQLDTASDARFQDALPLEPVNRPRLDMLRMDRAAARAQLKVGVGRFVDKRRQAQIAARHALQEIAAEGFLHRDRARVEASVIHAAELQLPEAWLPFVVAR